MGKETCFSPRKIYEANLSKSQISNRVFKLVKQDQTLPRCTKENYCGNIEHILEFAVEISARKTSIACSTDDRLRVMAIMLTKIEESLKSSILLLSLGLLEDHFTLVRRHFEAVTVFVYVAGRGEFHDYLSGDLKKSGKGYRPSKEFFEGCPFEFTSRIYQFFKELSDSVHPKSPGFAGINTPVDSQAQREQRDFLDKYLEEIYPYTLARFEIIIKEVVFSLIEFYENAIEDSDKESEVRIRAMQYFFMYPREIERVYNAQNFFNSLRNSWDGIVALITGRADSRKEIPTKRLLDLVECEEVKQLLRDHPKVLLDLGLLFVKIRMGAFVGSRF